MWLELVVTSLPAVAAAYAAYRSHLSAEKSKDSALEARDYRLDSQEHCERAKSHNMSSQLNAQTTSMHINTLKRALAKVAAKSEQPVPLRHHVVKHGGPKK